MNGSVWDFMPKEYEYQKEIYIELEYSLKIRRQTLYVQELL